MDFTAKYRDKDGTMHPVLLLKFDHSLRVAADSRDIAMELGWTAGDTATAETIGLLHDISRFPQFVEFRTFLDHKSFDHGERGYQIISETAVLSGICEMERRQILSSVRYHNKRTVDPGMNPEELRFVNLIRDADKLDILSLIYDTIRNNRHKDYPEILSHVDPDGPATPELIAEIRKCGYGSYENVRSMTDMNLMRMTWVYNINYLPALRRLSERGHLDQLDETMIKNPDVEELLAKARHFVAERLSKGNTVRT